VSTSVNKAAMEQESGLLVDFVNTRDIEEETDSIADPRSLQVWIRERTGDYVDAPDEEALGRLRALRESLRALLRTNNGEEVEAGDLEPLEEAAERSRFRATFSADGRLDLAPARSELSGFEARLLLAIERLQSHGAWPRLKACTDDECQWAFYDATRNHSRTWCSMDVCGNREKTRRYRERRGTGS
jgi:predicted RNA-binding Zn ribbon-like protein